MARRGSGFGIVMLVIVMLVVLLLVARGWKRVAPTAVEISTPSGEISVSSPGAEGVANNPGGLPNLKQMHESTSSHLDQVGDALDQTNQ
ncbi:MAG: hypothetical protein R3344_14365 [Acidobacteriota bacterium]|nr:hypothetical protein [Acidobacteriota bacterium]